MHMILCHENGLRTDAVLLAIGDDRMRVVVGNARDTTELRLIKDQWMSEEGDAIDIESLILPEGIPGPGGLRVVGNAA